MPVELGSTSRAAQPRISAAARQVSRAAARPCAPVAQLALPLFTTMARSPSPATQVLAAHGYGRGHDEVAGKHGGSLGAGCREYQG